MQSRSNIPIQLLCQNVKATPNKILAIGLYIIFSPGAEEYIFLGISRVGGFLIIFLLIILFVLNRIYTAKKQPCHVANFKRLI